MIAFILMILFSLFFIFSGYKRDVYKWFGAFAFFLAISIFSSVLYRYAGETFTYSTDNNLLKLSISTFLTGDYFMPYTLLIFSIKYSFKPEVLKRNWVRAIKFLLILPVVFMYLAFSIKVKYLFELPSNIMYTYISWSVVYYCLSSIFIISSFIKEKEPKNKLEKLIISVIITSIVVVTLIVGYIIQPSFNSSIYNVLYYCIIILMAIIIIVVLKFGILGFTLKIERSYIDGAIKAITPGTAVMNHSIKNEIIKISMCLDNIKNLTAAANEKTVNDNIEIIQNSTKYMMTMTEGIQKCMQDIVLDEKECSFTSIIDESIFMMGPYFQGKSISVEKKYNNDVGIVCDSIYLKELLNNIIKNAVDASTVNGQLEFRFSLNKKGLDLYIKDNGKGIRSEDIPYIFNPFFTTKKHKDNFGLGLCYCYIIMNKHGGTIEVSSRENAGTTVMLHFPNKRLRKIIQPVLGGM